MKKLLLALVFPVISFAQQIPGVCIQCTDPSEKLDVNGRIKSRDIPLVTTAQYVIVTNADGVHRKVLLSSLMTNISACPTFVKNLSNYSYLLFTSPSSIPNPNNPIVVNGMDFVSAGTWIQNNTYYFSYANISGQPLNINNPFTVTFSGTQQCNY